MTCCRSIVNCTPLLPCALVLLAIVGLVGGSQCPCKHGRCQTNNTCQCNTGWTGKQCQRPCQDVYQACEFWNTEGRCVWAKKFTRFFMDNCPVTCKVCTYDKSTIPPGLPLPPYLELLKPLIGEWHYDSDVPTHFPVNFARGGYAKTLQIMITEVPLFDTPSLNYSSHAVNKLDPNDVQEDRGFLWIRPGKQEPRQAAFMLINNSGISMLQEGVLKENKIRLKTVHDFGHPYSRASQPYLRNEHVLQWSHTWLMQSYWDDQGYEHRQTYVRAKPSTPRTY